MTAGSKIPGKQERWNGRRVVLAGRQRTVGPEQFDAWVQPEKMTRP